MVQWPNRAEWLTMCGTFEHFHFAVGCIDGILHRINRPKSVPQELYYSGYKKMHCSSTQIIVDAHGHIRYLKTGFHGRMNDAGQFLQLPAIGPGIALESPENCYLLGDKGYANRYPVLTGFRRNQFAADAQTADAQHIFNEELSRVRVIVSLV